MSKEQKIRDLVQEHIRSYAEDFSERHISQVDDPRGVVNMKIHNVFIEALDDQTRYYASLVRSMDSSLGYALEGLAKDIAKVSFDVQDSVDGLIGNEQTEGIARLLESYKRKEKNPAVSDYQFLRDPPPASSTNQRHVSDYYLTRPGTKDHFLIELKIGGDLDNKKARSEKEALLEQFAILSSKVPQDATITVYFATAYNRYGEGEPWNQTRVRQYFSEDELLIGSNFWNFVTQSESGYDVVLSEYRDSAHFITEALAKIREAYLNNGN